MVAATSNRSHRGELVVKDVLDATLEELGRVGYRALRFEEVAARAGVNRTTIYRRWPTKMALVRETLCTLCGPPRDLPDTGSFREDLLGIARMVVTSLTGVEGRVLIRMMMTEGAEPEVREVVDALRAEKETATHEVIDRAKARGELRPEVGAELVVSMLVGSIHHRLHGLGIAPEKLDLAEHVDMLLRGGSPR